MASFEFIREINKRIYEIKYKNRLAILKTNLTPEENSIFLDIEYTNKYNFLPKVYEKIIYQGHPAIIMEKLYPFNYEKSKRYINKLIDDVRNFQIQEHVYKLDINSGNILSRENEEIVLNDLWSMGISEGWKSNTVEGNIESLKYWLYVLEYKDNIKTYVESSLEYIKNENITMGDYGIPRGIEHHYENNDDIPPGLVYIKKLYIGLKIYKTLKAYLPTIGIDIKTYKPPLSGEGLYWEKYDEIENTYKTISPTDILKLIIEEQHKYTLKNIYQYTREDLDNFLGDNQYNMNEKRYMTLYYLIEQNLLVEDERDLILSKSNDLINLLQASTYEEFLNLLFN